MPRPISTPCGRELMRVPISFANYVKLGAKLSHMTVPEYLDAFMGSRRIEEKS